jgi:hypothetical protein
MTIFEQTLRDVLIQANVTDDRVFLIRAPQVPAPQQRFPYMVFFHIAPTPHYEQQGPLSVMDREYQISIFDQSQSRALAIGDTLRAYLEGFRGDFEDSRFYAFFHRTQTQAWEPDTQLYQIIQEYRILYAVLDSTRSTNRSSNRNTKRSMTV